ncbi:MAG: DNA/RNA non-specific endonuclease, partial [Maribacter sp.]|nr:DNA/RNA non-specific endonuclease [Maribacter sp.]
MNQRKKNRAIYTVLLLLCIVGFWLFENFYTPDTYSSKEDDGLETSIPSYMIPSSSTGDVIHHDHFIL